MSEKTVLERSLETHHDLKKALSCTDGCDKDDIRDSFLISKICELQARVEDLEAKVEIAIARMV